MNEEQRVLIQILEFVQANTTLGIHIHFYPTNMIVQGGYDEAGKELLYHKIYFEDGKSLANEYHRLYEGLKQLKETN